MQDTQHTIEQVGEVKNILERLANGEAVFLGQFGDAGTTTDADVQASIIRELADLGITKLYEM